MEEVVWRIECYGHQDQKDWSSCEARLDGFLGRISELVWIFDQIRCVD